MNSIDETIIFIANLVDPSIELSSIFELKNLLLTNEKFTKKFFEKISLVHLEYLFNQYFSKNETTEIVKKLKSETHLWLKLMKIIELLDLNIDIFSNNLNKRADKIKKKLL